MEPIRPDEDELRAGSPSENSSLSRRARRSAEKSRGQTGQGASASSSVLPMLLTLAVAVGLGAMSYTQSQRIAELEGQLQEAEYWARQSKLALARFEGELSETGENLAETGESIQQRLASQEKRLDTADSEIAKLWGVANDRNKKRLNTHEEQISQLQAALTEAQTATATLDTRLKTGLSELEQSLNAVSEAGQSRVDQLRGELSGAISENERQISQQATAVDRVLEEVDARLVRFQREQTLTQEGVEGRIAALETQANSLADAKRLDQLQAQLNAMQQTVDSIDASRAQLTSRLVRLADEVSRLRSAQAQ